MQELLIALMVAAVLAVCVLAWKYRWNILHLRRHTYQDLVDEKERLHSCVWDWRYPDGTFVPQNKRQRMFRDLQVLSRKIRKHPDNPDNQKP